MGETWSIEEMLEEERGKVGRQMYVHIHAYPGLTSYVWYVCMYVCIYRSRRATCSQEAQGGGGGATTTTNNTTTTTTTNPPPTTEGLEAALDSAYAASLHEESEVGMYVGT